MQGGTHTPAGAGAKASNVTPPLPAELLSRIVSCLVPPVDPNASTLPHPTGIDLDFAPALPPSTNGDLLSAAASSTVLHHVATQTLYRSPLLRTLKSLNLLASALTADAKKHTISFTGNIGTGATEHENKDKSSRAAWIRSLHLPPGDGLLQPGDTLADQTCYSDSLRAVFDHASRLDFLSLEHRQAGAALLEFLHPATACRPRRITLSNLSFSAPPFSTTRSLAPLSQLTHLHLIKIVPPPALISYLVGEQINADEQGNVPSSIQAGLSPRETLECLRLSLLPPDALVEFAAYIRWRKAWKAYEQLSPQQQAHQPAPRAPRGPARRFAVQEALYDLAVHSSRLPRLRLVLLELSPLGPLPSPIEQESEVDPFAAFLRSRGLPPVPMPGSMTMSMPSDHAHAAPKARKPQPADVRAQRSDADTFFNALQTSRTAANRVTTAATSTVGPPTLHIFTDDDGDSDDDDDDDSDNDDNTQNGESDGEDEAGSQSAATGEDLRTAERDKYWRLVEAGKTALIQLWTASQQTPAMANTVARCIPNIRVVTARANGHDRREGFQDFYCQAQNQSLNSAALHLHRTEKSVEKVRRDTEGCGEDVGCWADPDVFELVFKAPWLSFKSVGGNESGWYWTGELPRVTDQPSTYIPSRISIP